MRSAVARSATITLTLLLWTTTPAGAASFPETVALPDGFAPEGIAVGRGHTFYTGSLAGAGVWRGDLRTGDGQPLVSGGGPFVGMKVDNRDRLWVAGGPSGVGYVFDARDGTALATIQLAPGPTTFVNDVVVTGDAAWFTDSFRPVLYRVDLSPAGDIGPVTELDLTGQITTVPGQFNLNGIDATADGTTLVVVVSSVGALYAVDAASGTATVIDLGSGSVTFGDGILLDGLRLYVVRNFLNEVAVVALTPDLGHGTVSAVPAQALDIPTTVARFGSGLYVVNARFATPVTPTTDYWATRVEP